MALAPRGTAPHAESVRSLPLPSVNPSNRCETREKEGRNKRPPKSSARHLAGFDRLQHGAQVVAVLLGQTDVALQRLAVQTFALRDLLGALRERFRQAAARQVETQATG